MESRRSMENFHEYELKLGFIIMKFMGKSLKAVCFISLLFSFNASGQSLENITEGVENKNTTLKSEVWNPNLDDGKYLNPIIYADYSDLDVCRCGDDYFMTASSFGCMPGLPILHSNDLVNWKLVNYALKENYADSKSVVPQHGKGVWAPCIKYHDGLFYIYWGDPDRGIYMVKTDNPFGEWERPVLVKEGIGMIDPSPLWDDDGKAYLINAWAGSRAKMNSILTLWNMSADGTSLNGEPIMVYDGYDGINHTVEGPKLYKENGFYYIFAPAGGVADGWQLVLRSKNIYGPYECRTVMKQGNSKINGPHQGAWVETSKGESWFFHFQDKGAYGRIVHLNPMTWKDGWPIIGIDENNDGCGEPVESFTKPSVKYSEKNEYTQMADKQGIPVSLMSDEFNDAKFGLQWQWMSSYKHDFGFVTNMGYARIYGHILSSDSSNCWEVPNLLLQKFASNSFTATAKLRISAKEDEQSSGLIVMGLDYCRFGLRKDGDKFCLEQVICRDADKQGKETIIKLCEIPYDKHFGMYSYEVFQKDIYLRVKVSDGGICLFSYSLDGENFIDSFTSFNARVGKWIGAKLGLFSIADYGCTSKGWLDVDWFRVEKSDDTEFSRNLDEYKRILLDSLRTSILTISEVNEALEYCDTKVRKTLSELKDGNGQIDYSLMPRNILDGQSVWNTRKATKDEWCSGFWPGILWYDYENTKDSKLVSEAEAFTSQLEYLSQIPAYDHDLGFLVFCSYGNAYRLTGNPKYKKIIVDTADSLATLFRPNVGTILSWPRNVGMFGGHNTIMDNMINLEMLIWASKNGGDKSLYDIAVSHADKTMKCHFRPDYTSYHVAVYDSITGEFIKGCTHQGYSDTSMWARGQSWAIYGYTMMYRETGDLRFLDFAQKVTDVYLRRLPDDLIPYWDFDDPSIPNAPRDASASAVVASALVELSEYVSYDKSVEYLATASKILRSLGTETYRSGDKNSAFLLHSTGHKPAGSEIDASIIYADYYYIEALIRMKNLLNLQHN